MAPERSGQGSIPQNTKQQLTKGAHPKTSSILEDFLEIKIKEELDYKQEEIVYDQGEYICKPDSEEVVKYREGSRRKLAIRREEDQDLTSLSWLQSNNLLKSKPLKLPEAAKKHPHEESPTSDLAEETGSESSTSQSQSSRSSPPAVLMDGPSVSMVEETRTVEKYSGRHFGGKDKHHYSVPYDPQLHINSKPPYSFSCLIFMAIEDSHARALPVKEIYSWITDHFPYFNKAPTGWKNSVRHNLSLNKCFRKVDKAPNLGKGSLWIVDPQYRPNLLNALSKAPYHPCASLDRPAKAPILPPSALTPQQQDFISVKSQSRLPNPELFPYLSKRLAASEADRINDAEDSDEDSLDDMDAANVMLELKHGQTRQQNKPWRKKLRLEEDEVKLVISTSPSEDHTYSVDRVANYKQRQPVSPDEAYGGGSDSNDDTSQFLDENDESWSSDGAEQRNVASALLHLAGGSRKRPGVSVDTLSYKGTPRGKKPNQRSSLVSPKTTRKNSSFRSGSRRNEEPPIHNNNNTDKYSTRVSLKPKMGTYQMVSNSR